MIKVDAAGTRRLSLITTQNGAVTYVGGSSFDTSTNAYTALAPVYTTISSATTTSIDAAPAASTISDYDAVNIKNTYAGDHTMTLQVTSGSGGPFVLKVFTLGVDESMNYAHGTGFQFFDADGNLKTVASEPIPPTTFPGGIRLTGVSYPQAMGTNLNTGNNDIYTVPSGKRAMIMGYVIYNNSAGNITMYPAIKIGGTYYRLVNGVATSTGTTQAVITIGYIAEAGETLAAITSTTNGLNVWFRVVEFDSTCPVYSSKLSSFSAGNNTVYTVPASKTALIADGQLNVNTVSNLLHISNDTGGARTVYWHAVPSGQSVGTGYLITASTNVNNGTKSNFAGTLSMEAGDFISVNTDANTAGQFAWVNVMELPV